MFDHIGLDVADLDASVEFYALVLAPLGYELGHRDEESASFGPPEAAALYLTVRREGPTARAHLAFTAPDNRAVGSFHAAGLRSGGKNNGEPGERLDFGENYYAAFVLDPDGNNIEAVCTTG